ncbi:MAG: hypothetical protein JZU65_15570 [Chlorobium sp.]|nr:hypothetical protein [Chlorobium sp.]
MADIEIGCGQGHTGIEGGHLGQALVAIAGNVHHSFLGNGVIIGVLGGQQQPLIHVALHALSGRRHPAALGLLDGYA